MKNLILKAKIFELVTPQDVGNMNSFLSIDDLIVSGIERIDDVHCVVYYFIKK